MDGLYDDDGYRREKRSLGDKLANLVVPSVDAAMEAGKLLMAMLDAVYVDTVEEKSVVAIRPKPAFRPIFEVATTRGGSGIVLINETPPDPERPEAESLCSWWRRGRVELHRERRLIVLLAA